MSMYNAITFLAIYFVVLGNCCMITTRWRGLLLKMHHTSINFLITSVIQFNEVVLNLTSDEKVDTSVMHFQEQPE